MDAVDWNMERIWSNGLFLLYTLLGLTPLHYWATISNCFSLDYLLNRFNLNRVVVSNDWSYFTPLPSLNQKRKPVYVTVVCLMWLLLLVADIWRFVFC